MFKTGAPVAPENLKSGPLKILLENLIKPLRFQMMRSFKIKHLEVPVIFPMLEIR